MTVTSIKTRPSRTSRPIALVRRAPTFKSASARRWQHQCSRRLQITDAFIVCASVGLAQYIRFGDSPHDPGYHGGVVTLISVLFAALWLSSIAMLRTRSIRVIGGGIEEYRRIINASFWTFGMIAIVNLLAKIFLARGYLAVALPVGTIGLLASRALWRYYIGGKRTSGKYQTMVMAIGDRKAASQLAQELTRNPRAGYVVVGAGIPGYGPSRGKTLLVNGREIPIFGDEEHAVASIGQCGADTVVLTGTERFGAQGLKQLIWRLETMDVDLVVAPGVMDVAEGRLALRPFAGFLLLHVEKPQYEGAKRFQKRAFDFCFALAALIAT